MACFHCGPWRGRDRDKEGVSDREKESQRGSGRDRERDTQRERERGRETEKETGRESAGDMGREREREFKWKFEMLPHNNNDIHTFCLCCAFPDSQRHFAEI